MMDFEQQVTRVARVLEASVPRPKLTPRYDVREKTARQETADRNYYRALVL